MPVPLLAITFATPEYQPELDRLIKSCCQHGQAIFKERLPSTGDWKQNCAEKPRFIRRLMDLHPRTPLLWLDADAELLGPVADLANIECDIAIRTRRNLQHMGPHVCSGTILIQPTDEANKLVNRWCYRMEHDKLDWDQRILQAAIADGIANVHDLDARYCWIFDEKPAVENALIKHHQASRRLKRVVQEQPRCRL